MNNHSVIIKKMRKDSNLSIKLAAQRVGKSTGWLSEVENAKMNINKETFLQLVNCYGLEKELRRYQLWATSHRKQEEGSKVWYEGAIYKHLRCTKKLSLIQAAQLLGVSKSHLSNIEVGRRKVDPEFKSKILEVYGYKRASFHNYVNRKDRADNIPVEFRLKILIRNLAQENLEKVFEFAQTLQVGA